MQWRQKIGDKIQVGFLRVEITADCRTKDLQPANAESPASFCNQVAFLLNEVNHTLNLSQETTATQLAAMTASVSRRQRRVPILPDRLVAELAEQLRDFLR